MKFDATLWKDRAPMVGTALLFFLANLVYFLAGRAVDASRADALNRQRTDARTRVGAAEAARQKAAADRAHIRNVELAADEFYGKRIGTIDDTIAAVVDEIHKVCRDANVNPHQISYGVRVRPKMPIKEMSIGFSVGGDYGTLRRLLRGFEADPRWVVVRGVQLSRKGETTGEGNVHLDLATYFYDAASESAPLQNARKTR